MGCGGFGDWAEMKCRGKEIREGNEEKRSKRRIEEQKREWDSGEMPEEGHRHHADMVLQPTEVENITEGTGLKQMRYSCFFALCSLTCFTGL